MAAAQGAYGRSIQDRFPLRESTGATRTRYDETPRYTEGLYDLGRDLYAWMVPNGSWGESNAGLVVGTGESLLIDTLWDVRATRRMLDAMVPLTGSAAIRTVVNTHADGDHFWGNELVSDAELVSSRAALEESLRVLPRSMVLLGRIGRALALLRLGGGADVGHYFQRMVAPWAFDEITHTPPRRGFETTLTLEIGGREVRLIEVGPAHTLGDVMVHVPDARTLFSADILFIGSTPVMWAGPLDNWLAALDRIDALAVDTIVPGHGPITDRGGVEQVRAYWRYIDHNVRERHAEGLSAAEAATDILLDPDYARQPFANWNSPERIMTSAHTIYRHLEGNPAHPSVPELVRIMRRQALLAHRLPTADPVAMRRP